MFSLSFRKLSGDVKKILESGEVKDQHLQFLENLGSGQCGTVYRFEDYLLLVFFRFNFFVKICSYSWFTGPDINQAA